MTADHIKHLTDHGWKVGPNGTYVHSKHTGRIELGKLGWEHQQSGLRGPVGFGKSPQKLKDYLMGLESNSSQHSEEHHQPLEKHGWKRKETDSMMAAAVNQQSKSVYHHDKRKGERVHVYNDGSWIHDHKDAEEPIREGNGSLTLGWYLKSLHSSQHSAMQYAESIPEQYTESAHIARTDVVVGPPIQFREELSAQFSEGRSKSLEEMYSDPEVESHDEPFHGTHTVREARHHFFNKEQDEGHHSIAHKGKKIKGTARQLRQYLYHHEQDEPNSVEILHSPK